MKRVIYISSGGTVYGVPRCLPVGEEHPLDPISAYGISKVACEKFVAMYSQLAGSEYRILRPANAFGEGQPLNRGQGILGVLAARFASREALEVWGSGNSLRDYIHVDDIVEAIVASIKHTGKSRVFNVSTGVGHSVISLIDAFRSRVGPAPEVVYVPNRGFDVSDNVLDSRLLSAETGWMPKIGLDEGIDRIVASFNALAEPINSKQQVRKTVS